MGGPTSTETKADMVAAFLGGEPIKAYSARVGASPNTVRACWAQAYGADAVAARGKRIQADAASVAGKGRKGTVWNFRDTPTACTRCQTVVPLKANQTAQMDLATFLCSACERAGCADAPCPVCGQMVDGVRGLAIHFRYRRENLDEAHAAYSAKQEDAKWVGKVEGQDYVVCLECGHRTATLGRHLVGEHGVTAADYRKKHGANVRIRCDRLTEFRSKAAKGRRGGFGKGETKETVCVTCGGARVVSKFFATGMHDGRCETCQAKDAAVVDAARWAGKSEPQDFVTCLVCGYRAESLVSHLQHHHAGYRDQNPNALVVALCSPIRDKTAIKGVPRSLEFRRKVSVAKTLPISKADFDLFRDNKGTLDLREMALQMGCTVHTLRAHLKALGLPLRTTRKYRLRAQEKARIPVTVGQLAPFKLKNDKISLARAVVGLGLNFLTLKAKCRQLGLPWAHGNVAQHKCLLAVGAALGGMPYKEEWNFVDFVNPKTGCRFKFDGFFQSLGLLVEFQGCQHYTFPNKFMRSESYRAHWEEMVSRDQAKREMALAAGMLYLEIREDEPYTNVAYLRGRLAQLGITVP